MAQDTPEDPEVWYGLAAKQAQFGMWDNSIRNLERSFELNAPILSDSPNEKDFRALAWQDTRFRRLREKPDFEQLMLKVDPGHISLSPKSIAAAQQALTPPSPPQTEPVASNPAEGTARPRAPTAIEDSGRFDGATPRRGIPPRPGPNEFLHDLAHLLDNDKQNEIRLIQQRLFGQRGVSIVVVTIQSMSDYDKASPSIESFARRWFDTWGIGSQEDNSGILILVSKGDRKARIELGAAWARNFDGFSKQLMDKKMVPNFKKGDFGAGLLAAVQSLSEIAANGPDAKPPGPGLTERILNNPVTRFALRNNPLGMNTGPVTVMIALLLGVGCLVAACFFPDHRKYLIICGVGLIVLVLFFWVVLAIVALLGGARNHDDDGWGGFGSGGFGSFGGSGGFGGGFSGGGGASGSW